MRQLWVSVPAGEGKDVFELAQQYSSANLFMFQGKDQDQDIDIVVLNLSNNEVGNIFEELEKKNQARVLLFPNEVFPFSGKALEVAEQVTHVTHLSPIEIWVNGLQSIGSWKGFIGYAFAASIVVWIAIYTNTAYMLVGAMLIAPFAGPAMNFALGTATGSKMLLKRNMIRYFVSLAMTIIVTAVLSLIFQQNATTSTMVQISEISSLAILLPLVAGAVGAHSLSQSQNNSLVPGSAVGMLIAASLAPPAGLIGMSAAIGRWDMALNGMFLLLLQLFAINLSGALVFRYYGQSPRGWENRSHNVFWASLITTSVLLVGMLFWQFIARPDFQRSSQAQRANAVVQELIRDHPQVNLLETDIRYPRPSIEGQNKLLGTIYVERKQEASLSASQLEEALAQSIHQKLLDQGYQQNYVTVTVFESP